MSKNNKQFDFFNMLRKFGIKKLFNCKEFYFSLIFPLSIFYLLNCITRENTGSLFKDLIHIIIVLDVTVFSVVITGLALLLSLADGSFLKFLKKHDLYISFFFPFYLAGVLWILHIIYSLGLIFFSYTSISLKIVDASLLFTYIFGFLYALLNSISLIKLIINLGHAKVRFEEVKEKVKSD
ncbi:hypothetical protein [Selenihalanaerobacter shriftii]|uniref:Uncharacterized protein n=1 Tax=Selenihalanaerobacter shriftii TaxID=142842 RepID=A0A1T4PL79_9FIRM|nr:hypothetical protein [Selenihalanaerobacter shriftii]SJZ91987.1 hypothetical protein SAMN02745118_02212 [Selenihalanaerobacter shriftii]